MRALFLLFVSIVLLLMIKTTKHANTGTVPGVIRSLAIEEKNVNSSQAKYVGITNER